MKHLLAAGAAAALVLAACADADVPAGPDLSTGSTDAVVVVTSAADAGPGSFRDAVLAANADPAISTIEFESGIGSVALEETVVYSGTQALTINGRGATLDGTGLASGSAFLADGGGNLAIRKLSFEGAPGTGLTVDIPDLATGIVEIALSEVVARNNGLHGALINDQAEYFNDPASTSDSGSAAGLLVTVSGSRFEANGFTDIDQDGLRINEGGPGDLSASIQGSNVLSNGGDGVELDERAVGNAVFSVQRTELSLNGAFTSLDFDDGMDVDESGDGDIIGRFRDVVANGNFEQGLDINENDAGSIQATMQSVQASNNAEEGIEYEEDDDFAGGGDIVAQLAGVLAVGNGTNGGDAGLKLREKGEGNLNVLLQTPVANGNLIGGIQLREDAGGDLFATLVNATADGNAEDGIDFDENGDGNLKGRLRGVTNISNNGEAGIDAEQQLNGTGLLQHQTLVANGNGDGPIDADAGVVVTPIP